MKWYKFDANDPSTFPNKIGKYTIMEVADTMPRVLNCKEVKWDGESFPPNIHRICAYSKLLGMALTKKEYELLYYDFTERVNAEIGFDRKMLNRAKIKKALLEAGEAFY